METAIEIEGGDEGWRGSDDVHNGQRRSVQYFWWKVRSKVKHLNCEHVIRDNLNIRDYYYCCSKWSERSALVSFFYVLAVSCRLFALAYTLNNDCWELKC